MPGDDQLENTSGGNIGDGPDEVHTYEQLLCANHNDNTYCSINASKEAALFHSVALPLKGRVINVIADSMVAYTHVTSGYMDMTGFTSSSIEDSEETCVKHLAQ